MEDGYRRQGECQGEEGKVGLSLSSYPVRGRLEIVIVGDVESVRKRVR